jgi:hypothetical protein
MNVAIVENEKPNQLLDLVIQKARLKNDSALARELRVHSAVISNIRHGVTNIGPALIVRIHDLTEMPVRDIKATLGLRSLPCLVGVA